MQIIVLACVGVGAFFLVSHILPQIFKGFQIEDEEGCTAEDAPEGQPLGVDSHGSPKKAKPKLRTRIETQLRRPVTVGSLLIVALVGVTVYGTIDLGSSFVYGYYSARRCEADLKAYKESGRATDGFMAENSGAIINACYHGATLREALNAAEDNYYSPNYSPDLYVIKRDLRDMSDDIEKLLRYR